MAIIPPDTATHATCKKCGVYGERGRKYRLLCKPCYAEENRARVRRWNAENAEYHRQRAREWAANNPERVRERVKAWVDSNRDRSYQTRNAWRARNPEVKVNAKARRRSRLSHAFRAPLPRGWRKAQMEKQGGKCAGCGLRFTRGRKATVDHIQPLNRGGLHEPSNCQLMCSTCNLRKQDSTDVEFQRRVFGRLL